MHFKIIKQDSEFKPELTREDFINFLYTNLGEYGDKKEDIDRSVSYVFSPSEGKGGFLIAGFDKGELVSELVMNHTGKEGYIPEFILVYVATKSDKRGKGYGKQVIEKALDFAGTDVALHVEYDNPAKRLYEKIGFNSKYAEMRFKKENK